MAGHSKWANIKHKKAKTDEKRGKEFTKVAKEISIAARTGGGDPDANSNLRLAIQKAKTINMPNDNITRAIKKGTGELDSEVLEEIVYEGYAPGGVAIMLEIATDKRTRTAPEIRHLFSKNDGNLGETGCVSWMFNRSGVLVVNKETLNIDNEELMLQAIELGAEDVKEENEALEIVTMPEQFLSVKESLENYGIQFEAADIEMVPENSIEINEVSTAQKILKLIEALEDHDDVQNVYANFTLPDEIVEKL
ncbi:putative transcriptional regulatory protein YebC [Candidatus Syntrophocurvum alkaliphilum]|uniref:Probable transcriptional regulatory protein SYNTR_1326 n=1 Tax=Candidatus Syntrophocurvum alkaliphilum TaxID=2293317 RepID=A0A6I6DCF0_9FIRM|nr:YebC/PmpR family DNA-binding transcriptional regulator [Candidatus Syntrophocurvum alkaliphilum]QGT99919.1 putative transcriptional regulatory protein YebC [Candidatus Syntrophocurvum alkaliphilum]